MSKVRVFLSQQSGFSRLARRKTLAAILVGVSTLAIRVALIPLWGVPQPAVHDEFSYLLAADTYAHGKLTNPPHPMWIHFEGFHIIQQPTYMSMYPPGQGLILAAGQLLGHPWIGQLLATAAMCSCLCWMLQAWVPASWALLAACLCTLQLGIPTYWGNSYFGTSLTALGGMLALGALPRIRRHARTRDAVLMGIGLAVLANTRPYEGFVYSLPIMIALFFWIIEPKRIPRGTVLRGTVVPLVLVLGLTAAAMGYYFWRVTGNPLVMPYQVNRQTYAVAPYFIWEKLRPEPVYHHPEMRDFYVNWETRAYAAGTTVPGFTLRLLERIKMLALFFIGPVFALPLLAFPWLFRDRRMRLPLMVAATVAAGNFLEIWTFVHYLAPAVGLFFLLLVQCMRHLCQWRWQGRKLGQGLVRAIPVACLVILMLRIPSGKQVQDSRVPAHKTRHEIAQELEEMPGQQLVIVHYGPKHTPHDDWVYNRADIDASKIAWARDMGDARNQELLLYFKDRKVWRVDVDDPDVRLQPYRPDTSTM